MSSIIQPTNHDRIIPIANLDSNTNDEPIQSHSSIDPLTFDDNTTNNKHASTTELRILTLNVWGLKYISTQSLARLTHIAHLITNPTSQFPNAPARDPPTIVCLQELFTYDAYLQLRRLTSPILPHGHFYNSAAFGSGLAILSKYPIVETRMVRYSLNGRPSAFWRGDWYVGKGVACARVRLPREFCGASLGEDEWAGSKEERGGRYLEVFNTHLHAPYDEGKRGKDTYSCHRVAQAWEIGGLMRRALERGNVVVGCGDFNMLPLGLEWRVIQAQTRGLMRDVWRELHPESSVGAWVDQVEKERLKMQGQGDGTPPTVRQSLHVHGHTCDSVANTWRWSKAHQKGLLKKGRDRVVGMEEQDPKAKRLDYIFLGHEPYDGDEWTVKEARICMTDRLPELKCSLSDHFAVEAVIATTRPPPSENGNPTPLPRKKSNFTPDPALYPSILNLLTTYTRRQRLHRRRRLIHFLASVFITIGCWIAVFFSPNNYVSFALMLVASLGLMAGTVDGLIGGLFGGWELRGLKEWNVEVWRAHWEGWGLEREGEGEKRIDSSGMSQETTNLGEEELWGRVRDWFD